MFSKRKKSYFCFESLHIKKPMLIIAFFSIIKEFTLADFFQKLMARNWGLNFKTFLSMLNFR